MKPEFQKRAGCIDLELLNLSEFEIAQMEHVYDHFMKLTERDPHALLAVPALITMADFVCMGMNVLARTGALSKERAAILAASLTAVLPKTS